MERVNAKAASGKSVAKAQRKKAVPRLKPKES